MERNEATTPLQDERIMRFSPISDAGQDISFEQTSTDQILARLNSVEVLVREQHLATREYMAKGIRDSISIERGMYNKLCQHLQTVAAEVQKIQDKHQAEPALVAGIVGMVNQALLYLQSTAPAAATTTVLTENTADK